MGEIISSGKSDAGLRRRNNEDALVLEPGRGLYAVADGMGGAASGEVASRIFVETAVEVFCRNGQAAGQDAFQTIQAAFQIANERILDQGEAEPEQRGMGCTAELIAFQNHEYILGHVGDSRTYLFREGKLRRITKDHSLVQEQLDEGIITPDEAKQHALRHVIVRAVGIGESLAVDFIRGKCLPGDVFLLCSDGLTDMVDDAVVERTLSTCPQLDRCVDSLIESAKTAGGHDNITLVLCEVTA